MGKRPAEKYAVLERHPRVDWVLRISEKWGVPEPSFRVVQPKVPGTPWGTEPDLDRPVERMVCECGGAVFTAYKTSEHEGSIRCEGCGAWHILHDG